MPTVQPAELKNYIGKDLGYSPWLEVTQQRINDFADATMDHQYIHIDQERAKKTPFGGTIAHGFLTLSLIPALSPEDGIVLAGLVMGVNYGADKLRFLMPVRSGKRIRAHYTLSDATQKSETNFLLKHDVKVEIEGEDTPALIYEMLSMQIIDPA